jgi:murein L,D-transpeptidase YafK
MNTTHKSRRIRTALVLLLFVAAALAAVSIIKNRPHSVALAEGTIIDRIVVQKSARKLSLFRKDREIKSYRIALGANPVGPKEQEGDMKTPEGFYTIDSRNPQSDYHLALHISYPETDDLKRATARGVSAGCDIMIHGMPNGHGPIGNMDHPKDWTAGCIAVTDQEIEELWRITPDGTPIEIRP